MAKNERYVVGLDIGTTKIAMMLKPQEMWDMFTSVGLGQAPKIGFPGAVAGRLRPANKWRRIEQATMSYGYGLSVSLFTFWTMTGPLPA